MLKEGSGFMYCDAYVNENKMWYFDKDLLAVCEMDFDTYTTRILANYYGKRNALPYRVFCVDKILYFTFLDAHRVLKFDMEKNILQEIIDDNSFVSDCANPYVFTVMTDNRIWLIPRYKTTPTCYFDLSKELFYQDDTLNREIDKYVKKNEMAIVFPAEYDTQLWAVLWNTHRYLRYDLRSGEVEIFELRNTNIHLSSICYDGKSVWLTQTDNANLICVDGEENIIIAEDGNESSEEQYSRIVNLKDDIIVLPRFGNQIILICKKTKEIRKVEINRKFFSEDKLRGGCSKIIECHETQGEIYLFPWGITDLLLLDKEEMRIKKVNANNELKIYRDYINDLLMNGMSLKENRHIGLKQYMEWVLACQGQMNTLSLTNKNSIFSAIADTVN